MPYVQPPLTDTAVEAAERKIGYKLPSEYLDLLGKQNGGYIRYSLAEMVHDSIAGIGPYFPPLTNFGWDECQEHVSFPLQGLVPIDGDSRWYLCLDYRDNSRTPSSTHVDIERMREGAGAAQSSRGGRPSSRTARRCSTSTPAAPDTPRTPPSARTKSPMPAWCVALKRRGQWSSGRSGGPECRRAPRTGRTGPGCRR